MSTPDGRLHVTFNGEIYNYRELRDELAAQGVALRSNSDTEVLLHLYRRDGAGLVQRLRGMFAFAIWDALERRLFLARDPHGIKPLYYAERDGVFRFASQVQGAAGGRARPREAGRPPAWQASCCGAACRIRSPSGRRSERCQLAARSR